MAGNAVSPLVSIGEKPRSVFHSPQSLLSLYYSYRVQQYYIMTVHQRIRIHRAEILVKIPPGDLVNGSGCAVKAYL
ncbi:hypothetical protein TMatcc_006260 [Talaromyces marneffei ATCC 18224]